jgi:hypothetical protein
VNHQVARVIAAPFAGHHYGLLRGILDMFVLSVQIERVQLMVAHLFFLTHPVRATCLKLINLTVRISAVVRPTIVTIVISMG